MTDRPQPPRPIPLFEPTRSRPQTEPPPVDQTEPAFNTAAGARNALLDRCAPGCTIFAVKRSTSRSGKSADLDFFLLHDGARTRITDLISYALEWKMNPDGTITVRGWSTDAAWHVVQQLSFCLHGMISGPAFRAGHTLNAEWM